MKNHLTFFIFLILSVSFVWCAESPCKIMNLKGAVVYKGYCQHSAGIISTNEILSLNGVFLLEDKKNGSFKKVNGLKRERGKGFRRKGGMKERGNEGKGE